MLTRLAGQAGSRRGPSVSLSRLRAGLGPELVATSVGSHGGAWMIQLLGRFPLKFKLIIQVSAAVDMISKQLLGGWSNLVSSIKCPTRPVCVAWARFENEHNKVSGFHILFIIKMLQDLGILHVFDWFSNPRILWPTSCAHGTSSGQLRYDHNYKPLFSAASRSPQPPQKSLNP